MYQRNCIQTRQKQKQFYILLKSVAKDDEAVLKALTLEVRDLRVYEINKSGFGLDVSQQAFFEVCITRQNISRDSEYKTGRPSAVPAFQDMNSQSLGEYR